MRRLIQARFGRHQLCPGSDPIDVIPRLDRYFREGVDTFRDIPVNLRGTPAGGRLECIARNTGRGDTQLWQLAAALGRPKASTSCRIRELAQSGGHHRPLPSGDRIKRQAHRICRRTAPEGVAATSRAAVLQAASLHRVVDGRRGHLKHGHSLVAHVPDILDPDRACVERVRGKAAHPIEEPDAGRIAARRVLR